MTEDGAHVVVQGGGVPADVGDTALSKPREDALPDDLAVRAWQ